MNISQFNQDLLNEDHTYAAEAEYQIAFNWYNLMSFNCAYYTWNILQEVQLQDVYWDQIYDFQWNPISILEASRLTYQLQNSDVGIAVQKWNVHDIIADITSSTSSLSDWWSVIDKKYWNKTITLTLFVQWATHNDLIARIDDLKKNTQWVEWFFDINVWWTIRRYEATVVSITVPWFKKLDDFVEWIEMELLITSPHWSYKNLSQVYVQWQTSDFSKVVQNLWTYKAYPIIQLITNSWSTLTGIGIEIKSVWDTSWYEMTISETITPWSVVTFDYIEKKVLVNDVEVNFSGVMTELEVWQSVVSFDFTGSVDVNVHILHYPTFL